MSLPKLPTVSWRSMTGPVLLVSLMANLFLIGGGVGALFAPSPPPLPAAPPVLNTAAETAPARQRAPAMPMRDVIAQLPAEERRLVNEAFMRRRQETRATRDQITALRARVRDQMTADPFDPSAMAATMAELRAATATLQTITHTVLLESAPRLSPESRRRLADSLRAQ